MKEPAKSLTAEEVNWIIWSLGVASGEEIKEKGLMKAMSKVQDLHAIAMKIRDTVWIEDGK